ncbi:WAT1-related protein At2g37450-like isoform X2 [Hibiscus syriacus]|uniref:WAT1-related protein At2g37450-like isoform X2 n=1 Tax=Hibiscus syriacus TaxID=106335 RepID=UPI0019241C38|nr:WAT1-related protein At2g37450-like isoform X2 [Hibiscus syriacus]
MAWTFIAKYKPHLIMFLTQIGYAVVYFFTEAAFSRGLNPHIYVAYRFCLAACLMFPFAYVLERNCASLNMHFASLKYTSPTFVATLFNTIPSWTFIIAIILRMEVVDVKNPRGIAKILGTLTALAGVTIITLYKGPAVPSLWSALVHINKPSVHENWVKGPILTVASCITWAIWYILQAITLKKYPTQVSLAAWMNGIGGAQSAVLAACLQHKASAWSIKMMSVNFWSITYSGICSAIFVCLQIWCMKEKGPVFVAMFNSLQTVMVVVLAYFVLGERLYTGSIVGGFMVIIGLYLLLWGKNREPSSNKNQEQCSSHCNEIMVADKETTSVGESGTAMVHGANIKIK